MLENSYTRSLMKGLTRPVVLWLLNRKPRTGYELLKEIKRLTGLGMRPALVYPFLHSLEQGGYLVGNWMEKGRRRVKYYRITRKGNMLLDKIRRFFEMPIREVVMDLLADQPRNRAKTWRTGERRSKPMDDLQNI